MQAIACNNCFAQSHICDGKKPTCSACEVESVICETSWDESYLETGLTPDHMYKPELSLNSEDRYNHGGMTDNYRLRSPADDDLIFVKTPRLNKYASVTKRRVYQLCSREYVIWSHIKHKNILQFACFRSDREEVVLVEPWIENGNVLEYLSVHPSVDRLFLMKEISDGVCYLHEQRPVLVHGNLKADNILIRSDGTPLISDFGMSYVQEEQEVLNPSELDTLHRDNARWFPPERLNANGQDLLRGHLRTVAGDVFVFCRTLYSIVTGAVPFLGIRSIEVALNVFKGRPPDRDMERTSLYMTEELWACLLKGWSMDPSQRPTAHDVRRCLMTLQPMLPEGIDRDDVFNPVTTGLSTIIQPAATVDASGDFQWSPFSFIPDDAQETAQDWSYPTLSLPGKELGTDQEWPYPTLGESSDLESYGDSSSMFPWLSFDDDISYGSFEELISPVSSESSTHDARVGSVERRDGQLRTFSENPSPEIAARLIAKRLMDREHQRRRRERLAQEANSPDAQELEVLQKENAELQRSILAIRQANGALQTRLEEVVHGGSSLKRRVATTDSMLIRPLPSDVTGAGGDAGVHSVGTGYPVQDADGLYAVLGNVSGTDVAGPDRLSLFPSLPPRDDALRQQAISANVSPPPRLPPEDVASGSTVVSSDRRAGRLQPIPPHLSQSDVEKLTATRQRNRETQRRRRANRTALQEQIHLARTEKATLQLENRELRQTSSSLEARLAEAQQEQRSLQSELERSF